jgi:hypothetical protein
VARCAANIMKVYFYKKFWEELITYFPYRFLLDVRITKAKNTKVMIAVECSIDFNYFVGISLNGLLK